MRRFVNPIFLAVLAAALTFALVFGATYNGLLTTELRIASFQVLLLGALGWAAAHWLRKWRWHRTALDAAILVWGAAFLISLVANGDVWRRSVIALWFVGLYIALWYIMADTLANGFLKRSRIALGLIIAGVLVLGFGFTQVQPWITDQLPLMLRGELDFDFPRAVSKFDNPNTLGNFMAVLIPVALAMTVAFRGVWRWLMALYVLLSLALLAFTDSRGAWIGTAVGLAVVILLILAHEQLLRPAQIRTRAASLGMAGRLAAGLSVIAIIAVLAFGLVYVAQSLSQQGRTLDLRTFLYEDALQLFSQRPLTGYGLFTFGRELATLESMPPVTTHTHAHNIIFHVMAELGLPGLVALLLTGFLALRAALQNWRDSNGSERVVLAGGIGGFAAFVVHHQLDVPAMNPALALTGLLALAIAALPARPVPLQIPAGRFAAGALTALCGVLVAAALWSNAQFSYSGGAVWHGRSQDPLLGAEELQASIDADPYNAVYPLQQGFLYGLSDDLELMERAVVAYERYARLEPQYVTAYANLAGLYRDLGNRDAALQAQRDAFQRAPLAWQFGYELGRMEEEAGNEEAARSAYQGTIEAQPEVVLLPDWNDSALRTSLGAEAELSAEAQVLVLLDAGNTAEARTVWEASPTRTTSSVIRYVIDTRLALAEGDRAAAETALAVAETLQSDRVSTAWFNYGQAVLAQDENNRAVQGAALRTAEAALQLDTFERDDPFGVNIQYIQFFRSAIERQYLPRVYYPIAPPLLQYALGSLDR